MLYEDFQVKKLQIQKKLGQSIADRNVDIDSLANNCEVLEKRLMSRCKAYNIFNKNINTTWQDIQLSLSKDEVAIEFLYFNVWGTDSTIVAALTIRKDDDAPKFHPLFELSNLLQIKGNNHYISSDLTSLIWQPLNKELQGVNRIYFSPAGALLRIGIEHAPGMEKYEMYRLSSTREIIDIKTQTNKKVDLNAVLYGGIDYETSLPQTLSSKDTTEYANDSIFLQLAYSQHRALIDSLDLRGMTARYLPSTRTEIQKISTSLRQAKCSCIVHLGSEATEKSVKDLSGNPPSILHISTHGFYYTESQAKKKEKLHFLSFDDKHHANYEDKTLTRSGLLMAGANTSLNGQNVSINDDDGILTAKEIAQLDLRGIELVVLSACETASGDIAKGEGVFGLQRGFKKAGVKSILMSLWKVSDVSTEILMTEFYKNLCKGKSKRESLRLAQKTVREYRDDEGNLLFQAPHYWAGFVMLD